jgi:beta-N-acetylhexosaminidase
MIKPLLLSLAMLSLTACAKEEPKITKFVCTTKLIKPMPTLKKLKIIDKPIAFGAERIAMTKEYIKIHYGKNVNHIKITPKIIVLHWTADMSFDKSFQRLHPQKLFTDRKDIAKASLLNVSSQFLVARDGTIYRLMPENWMARHVIGLNYSSIGVENVGGKGNKVDDLTPAQRKSNIALIKYLKAKYPSIEYLIGHHEYKQMESTSLWLERDKGYRTVKSDPGAKFMAEMREASKDLGLKMPPKK